MEYPTAIVVVVPRSQVDVMIPSTPDVVPMLGVAPLLQEHTTAAADVETAQLVSATVELVEKVEIEKVLEVLGADEVLLGIDDVL